MKKTFKKITASIMAVTTLTVSMVGTSANAAGTISASTSGSGTTTKITYSFDVDGNYNSRTNNGAHYGQTGSKGFSISSNSSVTFSFGGARNAGANVKIYRESDNSKVTEFNIPIIQSGMPTLYYYETLSPGQYYVKIRSDSSSTYSTGGFTVSYISGTYTH